MTASIQAFGLDQPINLDLSYTGEITWTLEPLAGLSNLQFLDLSNTNGITSLEPLAGLSNLHSLHLYGADGITSPEPLRNIKGLHIDGASTKLMETLRTPQTVE